MHLPAWTGWGYSKDFPRLAVRPFRALGKNRQQVVRKISARFRKTKNPRSPTPLIIE